VPKLRQVLEHELGGNPALRSLPRALLDGDVTEVFLATGAPCESHAGSFAAWPGAERDVTRWFRLADGPAVGIRCRDGDPHGLALWQQERES
jgi:hypothetical protein